MPVTVELVGLEVFGHHGATDEEQRAGGTLAFDVDWDVDDEALADDLHRTVDYERVAEAVQTVSDGRRFRLLEALAAAVADEVLDRFGVSRVRVRVRKAGVRPGGLAVSYSAATVERSR